MGDDETGYPPTRCGRCGHEADDIEPRSRCPDPDGNGYEEISCPGWMWVM